MDQKLELLERVPLFAGVAREGLEEIGRHVDEIEVTAGTALTHEGRHEGYFFIIVSGTVRIERGGRTIKPSERATSLARSPSSMAVPGRQPQRRNRSASFSR